MDIKEALQSINQFKNVFKSAQTLEEALKVYSHAEEYMGKLTNDNRKLELKRIELRRDVDRIDKEYHAKVRKHEEDMAAKKKDFDEMRDGMDAELKAKRFEINKAMREEEEKLNAFVKNAEDKKFSADKAREEVEKKLESATRRLNNIRSQLENVG